uniref:Phosphatidate cytidylyltransferase n=1 Tax=uncultured Armatimonadetes bacterium TaxID=157466 RepID=A0A6J4JH22_9BACT|nr:Phosphatidate cytidylyltransferase [uncultured Armatimonadetes bacterium]
MSQRHNGPSLQDQFNDARQRAVDIASEVQERAREAQERAVELARERAREAQERARRAAEQLPPGLLVRLLSSLVGIPLLLLLVFAEGIAPYTALPFTFAVAICACVGGWEYFNAARLRGFQPTDGLAFVAIALLQFAAWGFTRALLTEFLPALLALLTIATLIAEVLSHDREPVANIGVTFLGVIYVGWLFSYLIFLRALPGETHVSVFGWQLPETARGAWIVLYVMAVTWSTDAGAYFAGVRWGRRPLAPRLSPKKTVEGSIGGLVAATAMSLAWGVWIGLPWHHCLLLGPVLAILAQIGDLCESALKRDFGIKDFGALLPGHGGILDRFDSLLFTAPFAYYYFLFVVGLR